MTTVEIEFHYAQTPSETVLQALAHARQVYGIRALVFDSSAQTLRVEFDATRLNAATVAQLLRRSGLDLIEQTAGDAEEIPAA